MLDASETDAGCTPSEKRSASRYRYELAAAALLYVALLAGSLRAVDSVGGGLKYVVAIAPTLGSVAMAIAMVRFAFRMDELQRRMLIDAAAIAAVVTAVATMALGFSENAGLERISMTWVWPITVVAWAVALPFVRRRYR